MNYRQALGTLVALAALSVLSGCLNTTHTVEAEVRPIHVTLDINLKVERELDDFFGDLDEQNQLLEEEPPSTDAS
ncbi:MAG: hypothetical protein AAGJ81_15215 [Verrucomicrobiota bacterium]